MKKVKEKLQESLPEATGTMRKSVHYRVGVDEARLYAHKYILAVETGRGPRKTTENMGFANELRKWMNAVSFKGKSNPKQLAYLINLRGTRKPVGREGLISKFDFSKEAKELNDDIGRSEIRRIIEVLDQKFKTK